MKKRQVDVAIIGAGTAGLYALREVRRAKKSFVLIDRGPLGTTCARVGCMPSKVALHAAELWSMREEQKEYGISGTDNLEIDRQAAWAKVRSMRDDFAAGASSNAETFA
ncbi:Mercuric reductase [Oligella urethralis]|uniref:FAD-dependent oxidoreductase n=1 Tax=Oligella urethralis TaxID=90245 RepID=UPI002958658F|nr:FAD-dependent oxidoreductase [Oligella urethralis]WOS38800.1 Mercuric reductase [Oligella urethralis]